MEIFFDLLQLRNYFDYKTPDYKTPDKPIKKKKLWLISKQCLQPVKPQNEKPPEEYDSTPKKKKGLCCAYEAARYGMREGLLTGAFFGGSWGIFKAFKDDPIIMGDYQKPNDGRNPRKEKHGGTLYVDTSKRNATKLTQSEHRGGEKRYVFKKEGGTDRQVGREVSDIVLKTRVPFRNGGYLEALHLHSPNSYDPTKFGFRKKGEKIEIVGYSFIKTTGSATAGSSSDEDVSSESLKIPGSPNDRESTTTKNKSDAFLRLGSFKEKPSIVTSRLDVIEESQSTKSLHENLHDKKGRTLNRVISNKLLHPRAGRQKDGKPSKENIALEKTKLDGIHRGLKSKAEAIKEHHHHHHHHHKRNEDNVYPRHGHRFSYLVDLDVIGNGYLSDIEINTKSKHNLKMDAHNKRPSTDGKLDHQFPYSSDWSENKSDYAMAGSQQGLPYYREADKILKKESHAVIRRSLVLDIKQDKNSVTISKTPRSEHSDIHKERNVSLKMAEAASHYKDVNKTKSVSIDSKGSDLHPAQMNGSQDFPVKPSHTRSFIREKNEKPSYTVIPEDIRSPSPEVHTQRSYIINRKGKESLKEKNQGVFEHEQPIPSSRVARQAGETKSKVSYVSEILEETLHINDQMRDRISADSAEAQYRLSETLKRRSTTGSTVSEKGKSNGVKTAGAVHPGKPEHPAQVEPPHVEIDQRSYVLSREVPSSLGSVAALDKETDFLPNPSGDDVMYSKKVSESTLEKEFKSHQKKREPDSISGYFEVEREINESLLEEPPRAASAENNIPSYFKTVASPKNSASSRKSAGVSISSVKGILPYSKAELLSQAFSTLGLSGSLQDNIILLSACNCALVLGVLCSVLSGTRACLAV